MFKNTFKIALRNLVRNRGYAALNIFGLALGLACALLLILFVRDELSYDSFHPNGDRVQRMVLERIYPERINEYAVIPHSYGPVAVQDLPEVVNQTRVVNFGNGNLLRVGDEVLEEDGMLFVDSTFFDVFGFELLEGDPVQSLVGQGSVVITERSAMRLFGTTDVMGKSMSLQFGQWIPLTIKGVVADPPRQSHMDFEYLMPINSLPFIANQENFISFSALTYLLLTPEADPRSVEAKFPQLVEQYAAGQIERNLGMKYEDYVAEGNGYNYTLQSLTDIYLDSNLEAELKPNGSRNSVYLFMAIAGFILLIAVINFMNLATARSAERAREVGVRKVLGSLPRQLILQFLTEAMILTVVSFVFGLALMWLMRPVFVDLAGKSIDFTELLAPDLLGWMLVLIVGVGLLAGSYPAFVLSSFRPVDVLKSSFRTTGGGKALRNGLVVFQFGISIALMVATAVVYQQMEFTRNKDMGYDRDQLMVIQRIGALGDQQDAFRNEVLRDPQVEDLGFTNTMPGQGYFGAMFQQDGGSNEVVTIRGTTMDEHYLPTMGIDVVLGRNFGEAYNDSSSIILNQAAVAAFGLKDPIGKEVRFQNNQGQADRYRVVGVVEDFHFQSLHNKISGLALFHNESTVAGANVAAVRISGDNPAQTMQRMEETWSSMAAEVPFGFYYLDEELEELYQIEQASGQLFAAFAALAILIACLGLFGLSAYTAQQRTKEIGIRKVLGASLGHLLYIQAKEITLLVWLAFGIAIPVVWYLMRSWLSEFEYHIGLNPWIFILAGVGATAISWVTVSHQSMRTARMTPVRSLRDE